MDVTGPDCDFCVVPGPCRNDLRVEGELSTVERPQQCLRLRNFGHFRRRREAFELRREEGVGFEKAAGGSVELGERERREQLIAARALSLRKGDGGLEGVFGWGGVRRIALGQDIAARPMKLAFERAVARALAVSDKLWPNPMHF